MVITFTTDNGVKRACFTCPTSGYWEVPLPDDISEAGAADFVQTFLADKIADYDAFLASTGYPF